MAYIPKDAKWYLADVIVAISIEDESRSVVHINTVLVRADSPEEAYQRAVEIGRAAEYTDENTDGKLLSAVFRGLRELSVVHEELDHGAELMFRERIAQTEDQIRLIETAKDRLSVFAPRKPSIGPNYMPKSLMNALEKKGFSESDITSEEA